MTASYDSGGTGYYSDPESETSASKAPKTKGIGLRGKLMVFLVLPLIIAFAGQGFFFMQEMNNLSDMFENQSTIIIRELAEKQIAEIANSVGRQVQLYLKTRPGLTKERFIKDLRFKSISIQKVGKTGYTALYERGSDGIFRTWAHPNENVVPPKLNDMSKIRGPLGENFDGFWNIYSGVRPGRPSEGYYTWKEKDGSFREKYMVSINIPGTRYNIASTTYIDEFTEPIIRLKQESAKAIKQESLYNMVFVASLIVFVTIIVFMFGGRLITNIKYLSAVTDRISLGDLDAKVQIRSKDELAILTQSISRMQYSLRLSMQRFQK